ncbi:hypothetical protein CGRA01v4_07476 [Colletotrichum graminicola]|nr:hypothetical protein CGRA01v4_07476 [Colletotrichum graminicola]
MGRPPPPCHLPQSVNLSREKTLCLGTMHGVCASTPDDSRALSHIPT